MIGYNGNSTAFIQGYFNIEHIKYIIINQLKELCHELKNLQSVFSVFVQQFTSYNQYSRFVSLIKSFDYPLEPFQNIIHLYLQSF